MSDKRLVYLTSRIDFGKYRTDPSSVKEIIDSGKEGLQWMKWLMNNSWNFEPHETVTQYIEQKEVEYGLLQPERS